MLECANLYSANSSTQFSQAQRLLAMIDWSRVRTALDVGCGTGELTLAAWRHNMDARILAIDSSAERIARAQDNYGGFLHNCGASRGDFDYSGVTSVSLGFSGAVDFECMAMEQLNFTRRFDLIFSSSALHWAEDLEQQFAKLWQALKPGGYLAIHLGAEGNYAALHALVRQAALNLGLGEYFEDWKFPARYLNATQMAEMLKRQGFAVDDLELVKRREKPALIRDFTVSSLPYYQTAGLNDDEYAQLKTEFLRLCYAEEQLDLSSCRLYALARRAPEAEIVERYTLSQRESSQMWQMLLAADREFYPALSTRKGTMQLDLEKATEVDYAGPREYFNEMIKQRFLMAKLRSGKLCAFLSFRPNCRLPQLAELGAVCYVTTICTVPNYRSRGYASCLLDELEEEARFGHAHWIVTRTWSTNTAQRRVLQKMGYRELRCDKDARGRGVDTLYYGKQIA